MEATQTITQMILILSGYLCIPYSPGIFFPAPTDLFPLALL